MRLLISRLHLKIISVIYSSAVRTHSSHTSSLQCLFFCSKKYSVLFFVFVFAGSGADGRMPNEFSRALCDITTDDVLKP